MKDLLLIYLPVTIFYLVLESTVLAGAPIPDISLLAVFHIGCTKPSPQGAVFAFAVGYLQDVFSGGVLGLSSLALVFVFAATYLLTRKVHFSTPFMKAGAGAAFTLLGGLIVHAVLLTKNPETPFLWSILLDSAVTGAFAPLVLTGFERLRTLTSFRGFPTER